MGRRWTTGVVACVLAAVAACGGGGSDDGDGRLDVVASVYPIAEAATRVGGPQVQVHNLTPAGTEPHDLELSTRQVDHIEDADVVLYLGRGFQPSIEKPAEANGGIDLLEGLALRRDVDTHVDSHFWLDPRLMATAVDKVAAALVRARPSEAAGFRARAADYRRELAALDQEYARGLATCARRTFVTSHAAFSYLAARYDLTQLPIAGLSPEAEPDARRLASIADTVKTERITTIFTEDLVSPAVARALAREAGVRTRVLSPVEGLTKAQLDDGKTYLSVMRDNLRALRSALDCT